MASLVRALPLLLVFSLVLFVNTEMWQVFAGMPVAFIVFFALAFALLSDLFLMLRLPKELAGTSTTSGVSAQAPGGTTSTCSGIRC